MNHDVPGFGEHGLGVRRNRHAPRRIGRADDLSQIAACFRGIFINRADDFQRMLSGASGGRWRSRWGQGRIGRREFSFSRWRS